MRPVLQNHPTFKQWGIFLYFGVDRQGYYIHALFFCSGGILWYYLFLKSGYIPQALVIWGLVAVGLLLIPAVSQVYDRHFTHPIMVVGILYLPFEAVLGLWQIMGDSISLQSLLCVPEWI